MDYPVFGKLVVMVPHMAVGQADAAVRTATVEAYGADGMREAPTEEMLRDVDADPDGDSVLCEWPEEPVVNTAVRLSEDDLLIGDDSHRLPWGSMVSVKSARWALAPAGRHPLALRLSHGWPVLSVAADWNAWQLCLYRHGEAVQYTSNGPPSDRPQISELNFDWWARLNGRGTGRDLRERFLADGQDFAEYTRLDGGGIREAFVGCDLFDARDLFLFIREPGWRPRIWDVTLRETTSDDVRILRDQCNDWMVEAFSKYWAKAGGDTATVRTVLYGDLVAGLVAVWTGDGPRRVVGYWIASRFDQQDLEDRVLRSFLDIVTDRPLHTRVEFPPNPHKEMLFEKAGFRRVGPDEWFVRAQPGSAMAWTPSRTGRP